MPYELRVAGHGVTDVGKVRSKNEDSLLILERQQVYCVADGMGGVSGGEIASQKVIECLKDQIGCLDTSVSLNDKLLSIHQAVVEANKWILGWSEKNEVQGAGTTLVLLALSPEYPWAVNILHAGDSRAYRYRGGHLQQITSDHSIEEAVGNNSDQPLPSQFKGLITNAVGLKKSLALELTHADQMVGDIWLLCSDGLDKMLSDDAIASIVASDGEGDANALAQRLVDEANAAGGKDNVSVVIVKVLECSEQPDGAVSVPFPGPLPSAPEEDTTSTETTLTSALSMDTETNGSMGSAATPDSETDFMSHGASEKSPLIRWILIAFAGIIAVVLLKLFFGPETPSATEDSDNAPLGEVSLVEADAMSAIPIEEIVIGAEESGDWENAYFLTQDGSYSKAAEQARIKKTIDHWYRLVWLEANRDPDGAKKALVEFIAAANHVLVSINRNILPAPDPWPDEPDPIANDFSRRKFELQQEILKELNGFRAFNARRISFMKLPDGHIAAAFKAGGLDERKYREFDRLLRDAEYAVHELERWLTNVGSLPITKDQIISLPNSYINYFDKVDIVSDELVEVLRIKPEIRSQGSVDPELRLQNELREIQLEWKSIQDALGGLSSGKFYEKDSNAIRHYLERLFQFEEMVEQEMNRLNR